MRFDFLEDKLKAILNYVHPRRRQVYQALLQKGRLEERAFHRLIAHGEPLALINFRSLRWHDDRGRYAYLLAKSLDLAGYQLIFYPQFHFLSRLNKYKALLPALNFRVLDPRIAPRVGSLPDSLMLYQAGGRKRVQLEWISAGPVPEGAMAVPYGMHPLMYQQPYVRPDPERSTRRRVFFGGNTNPKDYQRSVLVTRYGKINRVEVLGHLINQMDKSEITLVTRSKQLREALPDPRVVIVRTEDHPIATEDWLAVLSDSDFFLACPGAHMPMCHNVIEAMRVGTIPLLQYPEYFHPPLEPGVHCLVYRDKDTLVQQSRVALRMPREEIIEMKKKVTAYYEQHLHPSAWIERLTQHPDNEVTLVVNAYELSEHLNHA